MAEIDTSNMSDEEIAELQKQNCIFCKIAAKQIPAKILHEDDKVICILDINPASEGHILVYPKEHYMILPHIPENLLKHLFKVTRLMSKTLLKTLQTGGTPVFIANGMAAGQKAPHVLIHVFPRRMNDDLLHLPDYEMNEEQKEKLKKSLKPYFTQLFGKGVEHQAHKKAHHHKKMENEKPHDERKDSEKNNDEERTGDDNAPALTEKKERDSGSGGKKGKDGKKVDLDDIAKLFGG